MLVISIYFFVCQLYLTVIYGITSAIKCLSVCSFENQIVFSSSSVEMSACEGLDETSGARLLTPVNPQDVH